MRVGISGERPAAAQRLQALGRANEVRQRRAEVKQALCSGKVEIVELLRDPPDFLLTARLSQLLLAVPGYGKVRINELLRRSRISPLKTIGTLSQRQREELTLLITRK